MVAVVGIYMLAVGSRILTFTVVTSAAVIMMPILFTVRVSKRKEMNAIRLGIMHKVLSVAVFIGLCVVLYDFVLYANLLTQIQFRYNGYTAIHDSAINSDMSGLKLISKPVGEKVIEFQCEGWKLVK
ncbi:hypothetical protein [Bacillus cereus]|uniref:hypothetical protein n=1 Tax=Bacillus cereus TaxID=1396 RepID=UPI001C8CA4B6|nr:hypothetical protein [Bacillus cereus]MBX9158292.1 hypothetical protein [Bacillus cereus]